MDSILVVCYSRTGTSRQAARQLCGLGGWPLGEIHEPRARTGGAGVLRCIADSLLRRRPAIRYEGPDPADFRTVVLVGPVWAWGLAAPMRSFVAHHEAALRRVAVLSTMGSGGAINAVAEVAHLMRHAPVHAAAVLQRDVEQGNATAALAAFAEALQPRPLAAPASLPPLWQHDESPPLTEQP
jgi:hypothetical protein